MTIVLGTLPDCLTPALVAQNQPPLPLSFLGRRARWRVQERRIIVSLGLHVLSDLDGEQSQVWLAGTRCTFADAGLSESDDDGAHALEVLAYLLVGSQLRRTSSLMQRDSLTFQQGADVADAMLVRDLPRSFRASQARWPQWRPRSANWPTQQGRPMTFVGQSRYPHDGLAIDHFSEVDVYLFAAQADSEVVLKCHVQHYALQTPGKHYRDELGRRRYE